MTDDGIDAEELPDGSWRWVWQSPGGSMHIGPDHHDTPAKARKAGRTWLRETEKEAAKE